MNLNPLLNMGDEAKTEFSDGLGGGIFRGIFSRKADRRLQQAA